MNALREPGALGDAVITHYQRLLDYIVPDQVHVLVDGRIAQSGDKHARPRAGEARATRASRRARRRSAHERAKHRVAVPGARAPPRARGRRGWPGFAARRRRACTKAGFRARRTRSGASRRSARWWTRRSSRRTDAVDEAALAALSDDGAFRVVLANGTPALGRQRRAAGVRVRSLAEALREEPAALESRARRHRAQGALRRPERRALHGRAAPDHRAERGGGAADPPRARRARRRRPRPRAIRGWWSSPSAPVRPCSSRASWRPSMTARSSPTRWRRSTSATDARLDHVRVPIGIASQLPPRPSGGAPRPRRVLCVARRDARRRARAARARRRFAGAGARGRCSTASITSTGATTSTTRSSWTTRRPHATSHDALPRAARRQGPRGLQRDGHRPERGAAAAERAPGEPQPAPERRRDDRHQAAPRDRRPTTSRRATARPWARSTTRSSSTCARAASPRRRRGTC